MVVLAGVSGGIGCQNTEPQSPPDLQVRYGSIAGQVIDNKGTPCDWATVTVFGTQLFDETDDEGNYRIDNVPAAAPRYIVTATKRGLLEGQSGNIDVVDGQTTTVNLTMQKPTSENRRCKNKLSVNFCYLLEIRPAAQKLVPDSDAVLELSLYPEKVKPYLEPGKYIESDEPAIVELARQIKQSLLPWDRDEQTKVAKAIYDWMVKNIEYDLKENFPDDVTCGNWQTTFGGWGHNFNEWCYTAKEVLEERRAIGIEYERLCTALLRAAGIPARPALLKAYPVTQWWVQLADGSGYWANMEISAGHMAYEETGDLWAKFPSQPDSNIAFYAINEDAPIHLDWYTENPCVWYEDYGKSRVYEYNAEGLETAMEDMKAFTRRGRIPSALGETAEPLLATVPHYELYSRGITIDLANIGQQKTLWVRFPLFTENEYLTLLDKAYWSNNSRWITGTELVTERDDRTGEELSYHRMFFYLDTPG